MITPANQQSVTRARPTADMESNTFMMTAQIAPPRNSSGVVVSIENSSLSFSFHKESADWSELIILSPMALCSDGDADGSKDILQKSKDEATSQKQYR